MKGEEMSGGEDEDDEDGGVGGHRLGDQDSPRLFNYIGTSEHCESGSGAAVTMVRRISPAWFRALLPSSRNLRRRARARPGGRGSAQEERTARRRRWTGGG